MQKSVPLKRARIRCDSVAAAIFRQHSPVMKQDHAWLLTRSSWGGTTSGSRDFLTCSRSSTDRERRPAKAEAAGATPAASRFFPNMRPQLNFQSSRLLPGRLKAKLLPDAPFQNERCASEQANATVCKTVVIKARRDTGAQLHFFDQHGGHSVIAAPGIVIAAGSERNRLVSPLSAAVPGSEIRVPS